jgi:hypothetical protein
MKRSFTTFLLLVVGWQFSIAQQIINTTTKSTCTYQASSSSLQGCVDENQTAVFTFNENVKTFVHQVNGTNTEYAIESRVYEAPVWTYRINNGEGLMFDLKINQSTREYYFYPVALTDGAVVHHYQ